MRQFFGRMAKFYQEKAKKVKVGILKWSTNKIYFEFSFNIIKIDTKCLNGVSLTNKLILNKYINMTQIRTMNSKRLKSQKSVDYL